MEQQTPPPTAAQEWRAHWPLVLAAMIGLSFGAVASTSLGLFMEPLEAEFGWSRAQIGLGLTVSAIIGIPTAAINGYLVDHFGPRACAILGLALTSLGFAGFALIGGAYVYWLLAWAAYALLAIPLKTTVWSTSISATFTVSRGLALAVMLGGLGLTQAFVPAIARWLVDGYGWRIGFAGLGLGWGGLALLLVLLFFRDPLSNRKASPASAAGPEPLGLTLAEAMRSPPLLRISLAIFLQAAAGAAAIVHLVPILGSMGISRVEAASMAALMGLGSMAGKLCTGWLADRTGGDWLTCSCFALPALGYLLLYEGHWGYWALASGTFLIGYGMGAGFQMTNYLFTHYAGMRHFGKIFGFLSSAIALGSGIGPPIAGWIFDVSGNYALFLMLGVAQGLLSGIAVIRLGPYPVFRPAGGPEAHATA